MASIPRRLGRVAAVLAAVASATYLYRAATLASAPLLVAGAFAGVLAVVTWRAFRYAPRPPAAFAWALALAFTVAALADRTWSAIPLALAAGGYAAAATASSAWRFRTRGALT